MSFVSTEIVSVLKINCVFFNLMAFLLSKSLNWFRLSTPMERIKLSLEDFGPHVVKADATVLVGCKITNARSCPSLHHSMFMVKRGPGDLFVDTSDEDR